MFSVLKSCLFALTYGLLLSGMIQGFSCHDDLSPQEEAIAILSDMDDLMGGACAKGDEVRVKRHVDDVIKITRHGFGETFGGFRLPYETSPELDCRQCKAYNFKSLHVDHLNGGINVTCSTANDVTVRVLLTIERPSITCECVLDEQWGTSEFHATFIRLNGTLTLHRTEGLLHVERVFIAAQGKTTVDIHGYDVPRSNRRHLKIDVLLASDMAIKDQVKHLINRNLHKMEPLRLVNDFDDDITT